MTDKNNLRNTILAVIVTISTVSGALLAFMDITKSLDSETFDYAMCIVATIAAIGYGLQTVWKLNKFAPYGAIIWLFIALLTFLLIIG
ncbi:MAG: hypothetical protein WCV58_03880 [Patescibacteria group bacterium]